jgi:hypothetical protein
MNPKTVRIVSIALAVLMVASLLYTLVMNFV